MKKNYVKKLVSMFVVATMAMSLLACGKQPKDGGNGIGTDQETVNELEQNLDSTADAGAEIDSYMEAVDVSGIESALSGRVEVSGTDFVVNGNAIYMNGVNTPWDKWNDFGGGFNAVFWKTHFEELSSNGINSCRIWFVCNGDKGIEKDDNGFVTGCTEKFWQDCDTLFKLAQENGIYIMATLMSFDNFKDEGQDYMFWRNLLDDDAKVQSMVDNYVIPFCRRYDSFDSLWSIDLCNEPDWIHENSECGKIGWDKINNLFAREAVAIHENSDVLVTIGYGMIKYNSTKYEDNYGSEANLRKVVDSELAFLDFDSPHFYEWESTWFGFPFDRTPVEFGLDGTKPAIIGEFPATGFTSNTVGSVDMTSSECYINNKAYGWNGLMAWTSNGVDNCGKLSDFVDGARANAEIGTSSRTIDADKPMIALTFDDGPNTTTTSDVIDMLDKYDVVGTFFLIGSNVTMDSIELAKKAYAQGNEIECHSYKHDYMNKMTDEEIVSDIENATKMCKAVTGAEPKFFRPPYIAVNQAMFDNIPMTFISGVGCNDWDASVDTQTRIDKILESACDGEIVLLHDAAGNSQTVEALDTIIPTLLDQGYQLVTVSELFELKGITPESGRVYSNVYQTTMY